MSEPAGTEQEGKEKAMIAIDGKTIGQKAFPDGTPNLLDMPVPHAGQRHVDIKWCFDDSGELALLYMIASHYRDAYPELRRNLFMPYVPNARMDRVHEASECFTLKYMCQMLNSLGFARVDVFDPHSDVAAALIDRVHVVAPDEEIARAIEMARPDVLLFPDAGAQKRYAGVKLEGTGVAVAEKHRDWKTGRIESVSISRDLACLDVLIIDDICSYGGTFKMAIDEMNREHGLHQPSGVGNVGLYVSHCEKSIFDGRLFQSKDAPYEDEAVRNLKVYTTDSILRPEDVPERFKDDVVFVRRFREAHCDHPTEDETREIA